jgi:hypothetical protein
MDDGIEVTFYPSATRWLAAALRVGAGVTVLTVAVLAVADLLQGELAMPPARALRALVLWALLPEAAARALALIGAARLVVSSEAAVLTTRWARFDLPRAALASVRPWVFPLPSGGLTVETRSGRRFCLGARPPGEIAGQLAGERPTSRLQAYVDARGSWRRSARSLAVKLGLFPFLLSLVVFRTHQMITYGGWLGEYYLLGLGSYLATLGRYAIETAAQLILYAGVWRGAGELVALAGTMLAPRRARSLRRIVEWALALVFYAGVPALVALRLLA